MDTTNTPGNAEKLVYAECVPEAVEAVLHLACGLEIQRLTGESEDVRSREECIVAMISLVGDVQWCIYLGLERETASGIAESFAGFEIPFDSDDMADAAGELANMVGGEAKTLLAARGADVLLSLPSTMRGADLVVAAPRGVPSETTFFESEHGTFWVQLVAASPAEIDSHHSSEAA